MTTQIDMNCTQRISSRTLSSPDASELHLTGSPAAGASVAEQAREVYTAMRDQLKQTGARLFGERMFGTREVLPTVDRVRREVFADLDDGVAPTRIVVERGATGPFAGIQVHAIQSDAAPEPMRCCGLFDQAHARTFAVNGSKWLFLNGLNAAGEISEGEQARRIFFCAGCFLRQAGANFHSVARTWLWLKEVCDWYGDLNAARTDFFKTEGLIDMERRWTRLPASTGIGLYGENGAAVTLDLIAVPGREDEIKFVEVGGDQHSAFDYGSAFSRASVAPMPGGSTGFISGTAAIDDDGVTEHVGQIEAQVRDTIAHARSLLADLGCGDAQVLTSFAYCKTPEVEQVFREIFPDLSWPCISMIGDVCRPELLFEVEVTASPELNVG